MENTKFITNKFKSAGGRNAFTLMEMLVVISIISVLLGLLYGALERAQKFSRRALTYTEIKNIETAFQQYFAHYQQWPSNNLAQMKLTSDIDSGFVIDLKMARMLQGVSVDNTTEMDEINPARIPFLEFARYSRSSSNPMPINPFKSLSDNANDTSRAYKVLFDMDGDRQILVPGDDQDASANNINIQPTNIIASVVVWTMIPATRTSDASGSRETMTDVILGSWDSFSAK